MVADTSLFWLAESNHNLHNVVLTFLSVDEILHCDMEICIEALLQYFLTVFFVIHHFTKPNLVFFFLSVILVTLGSERVWCVQKGASLRSLFGKHWKEERKGDFGYAQHHVERVLSMCLSRTQNPLFPSPRLAPDTKPTYRKLDFTMNWRRGGITILCRFLGLFIFSRAQMANLSLFFLRTFPWHLEAPQFTLGH